MIKQSALKFWLGALALVLVFTAFFMLSYRSCRAEETKDASSPKIIALPAPDLTHTATVEQAMQNRRSIRNFTSDPFTLQQVSNLLWAAQGITDEATGHRTAPSAMAKYPLTVYMFAGNVQDLPAGVYKYIPQGHKIKLVVDGDQRENVGAQPQMSTAPASFAFIADYTAMGDRAKDRSHTWADIEVGHSAQNVLLEEVALGLAGVGMGGFDEPKMRTTLKLSDNLTPVYIVSAGKSGL
jgi:SagB-type dehydrogenase family enzyme